MGSPEAPIVSTKFVFCSPDLPAKLRDMGFVFEHPPTATVFKTSRSRLQRRSLDPVVYGRSRVIFWLFVVALTLSFPTATRGQGAGKEIRIRILQNDGPKVIKIHSSVYISVFIDDSQSEIRRIQPGNEAVVSVKNGDLNVRLPDISFNASYVVFSPIDREIFSVSIAKGSRTAPPRRYAGRLRVTVDPRSSSLRLVNTVGLDDYVASVVGSEYGFDDLEGSKAMAVIIRSYALKTLGRHGAGFDQVDHNGSQVYNGLDVVEPVAVEAVEQTRDEVLTYHGDLVEAVYFAASGGHTAANEDVWMGPPKPYLRGKKDPYDTSPYASWTLSLPRKKVLRTLSEGAGFKVSGFRIDQRSPDGRVRTVKLLRDKNPDTPVPANDFRLWIMNGFGPKSLKSTLFEARLKGRNYVFDGHGFGHGVGLSQWGAHEMARRGRTYRDILRFYYTDVQIDRDEQFATLLPDRNHPGVRPALHPLDNPTAATADRPLPAEKPSRPRRRKRLGW